MKIQWLHLWGIILAMLLISCSSSAPDVLLTPIAHEGSISILPTTQPTALVPSTCTAQSDSYIQSIQTKLQSWDAAVREIENVGTHVPSVEVVDDLQDVHLSIAGTSPTDCMKPIQELLITSTGRSVSEFRARSDSRQVSLQNGSYDGAFYLKIARTALAAVEQGATPDGPFSLDTLSHAYPEMTFEQFRWSYEESGFTGSYKPITITTFGAADALTSALVVVDTPSGSITEGQKELRYFVQQVAPLWQEADNWIKENATAGLDGRPVIGNAGTRVVTLVRYDDVFIMQIYFL